MPLAVPGNLILSNLHVMKHSCHHMSVGRNPQHVQTCRPFMQPELHVIVFVSQGFVRERVFLTSFLPILVVPNYSL